LVPTSICSIQASREALVAACSARIMQTGPRRTPARHPIALLLDHSLPLRSDEPLRHENLRGKNLQARCEFQMRDSHIDRGSSVKHSFVRKLSIIWDVENMWLLISDLAAACQHYLDNAHTCMHWCPGHLFSTCHNQRQKNAHAKAQPRQCDGVATSSPCKLLWPILKLDICPRNRQNPPQPMTQSQCVVTQALSDHPFWCGPHPVCLWFTLEAWPRSLSITKSYFHHCFCKGFSVKHATFSEDLSIDQKSFKGLCDPENFDWEYPSFSAI